VKRNLLLILGLIVGALLVINNTRRLLTFRTTSQKVAEAQARLEKLKAENEKLNQDLEYTKTEEFKEKEIRDKLGLAKEGEAVVILPKDNESDKREEIRDKSKANWEKWRDIFFGS